MADIIASDEQAKIIAEASSPVPIRDQSGNLIGFAARRTNEMPRGLAFSPEQIATLEKRLDSDGPWSATQEVLDRIQSASDE